MRASCQHCTREARYTTSLPDLSDILLCARHAQPVAHAGCGLDTVGACGHPAPVADMVARRPCPYCRALVGEDGDSPATVAYWAGRPVTLTERPTRWDDETGALVRLSDEELRREGWTRHPDGTFSR
jgi:hypothetical protein